MVSFPAAGSLPTGRGVPLSVDKATSLSQGAMATPSASMPVTISGTSGLVGDHALTLQAGLVASPGKAPTQGEVSFPSMYTGVMTRFGEQQNLLVKMKRAYEVFQPP